MNDNLTLANIATVSFDPKAAAEQGWSMRWWDFWFYLGFGMVIPVMPRYAAELGARANARAMRRVVSASTPVYAATPSGPTTPG